MFFSLKFSLICQDLSTARYTSKKIAIVFVAFAGNDDLFATHVKDFGRRLLCAAGRSVGPGSLTFAQSETH